jgi:hypothetical protein
VRRNRPADGRAELHDRLVDEPRRALLDQREKPAQQGLAPVGAARVASEGKEPCRHSLDVAVKHRDGLAEGQ